jgi:hypothetical protein
LVGMKNIVGFEFEVRLMRTPRGGWTASCIVARMGYGQYWTTVRPNTIPLLDARLSDPILAILEKYHKTPFLLKFRRSFYEN